MKSQSDSGLAARRIDLTFLRLSEGSKSIYLGGQRPRHVRVLDGGYSLARSPGDARSASNISPPAVMSKLRARP